MAKKPEMGDQPNAAEVLLDLWRCCQLMHSSTYCLADRQGLVYTFESFLLPVAEAFGAHDSDEQLGMFLKPELIALGKGHRIFGRYDLLDAAAADAAGLGLVPREVSVARTRGWMRDKMIRFPEHVQKGYSFQG